VSDAGLTSYCLAWGRRPSIEAYLYEGAEIVAGWPWRGDKQLLLVACASERLAHMQAARLASGTCGAPVVYREEELAEALAVFAIDGTARALAVQPSPSLTPGRRDRPSALAG
jgi:hypothetical protein